MADGFYSFEDACGFVVDAFDIEPVDFKYGNSFITYNVLTYMAPELLQYLTSGIQAELTEFAFGNIHLTVLKCDIS